MQKTDNSFWRVIVDEVIEFHQEAAGYIVIIDVFFSDFTGSPQMSDLLKYAVNLQNNLELRPPKKMIKSAKTTICAINLYSVSAPSIHASDIVKVAVDLSDMAGNYRGLVAPNLKLTEKSYYGTQFATSICNAFLTTDTLILSIQSADPDNEYSETPETTRARNVAEKNLRKFEAVHVGVRDKLREAIRVKAQS